MSLRIIIKRWYPMKKALVLAGGGAKGAYQAGCIKALQEFILKLETVEVNKVSNVLFLKSISIWQIELIKSTKRKRIQHK